MEKRYTGVISALVCICLFVTNVFAVSPNTYQVSSENKDITDLYSVVYESESPADLYALSPAIYKTHTGRIIVTWDLGGTGAPNHIPTGYETPQGWSNIGNVAYSDDGGVTFTKSFAAPFLFARPFEANNILYVIARQDVTSQLVIYKSVDDGITFTGPYTIDTRGWHSSPSEVYTINGYIYMVMETGGTNAIANGYSARAAISPTLLRANAASDLTNPSSWSFSSELAYADIIGNTYTETDYTGIPYLHDQSINNVHIGWLEANMIQIYDPNHEWYDPTGNTFYIYLRSSVYISGYACVMKVVLDPATGQMTPSVVKTPSGKTQVFIQMPGGNNKFFITYDSVSHLYWLVSSQNTDSKRDVSYISADRTEDPANERSRLALYYSPNAVDWTYAGLVSKGNNEGEARNYASMAIDGEDLLVISRSGDENANTAHNNNLITLHRIKDFRNRANAGTVAKTVSTVYSSGILNDASVKNLTTYTADNNRTIVTCAIDDSSKILYSDDGKYFVTALTTPYTLGKPVRVNNVLYVFGVASQKLVVYKSAENGVNWQGPYTLDTDYKWHGAPDSAVIEDGYISMALEATSKARWTSVRGYNSETSGSYSVDQNGNLTLNGYGAAGYTGKYNFGEGDSISFTVSPETLNLTNDNKFGMLFGNTTGFYGDAKDKASGFAIEIKSFSDYRTGFNIWYSPVANGVSGTAARIGNTNFGADLSQTDIQITVKKKTQTVSGVNYTWSITIGTTVNSSVYTYLVPATEVPDSLLSDGVYFSAGCRNTLTTKYVLNDINFNPKSWSVFSGYSGAAGSLVKTGSGVTLTGYGGAEYRAAKNNIDEGTAISVTVSPKTLLTSSNNAFDIALMNGESFYTGGSGISVQLRTNSSYTSGGNIWYAPVTNGTVGSYTRLGTDNTHPQSFGFDMTTADFKITLIKKSQTVGGVNYSWEIIVTNSVNTTVFDYLVPTSGISDTLFANGAYLFAGSKLTSVASVFAVTNPTINDYWKLINGYSKTSGNLADDNSTATLTGYGAVNYAKTMNVPELSSVSLTVSPETLLTSSNNLFDVALMNNKSLYSGGSGISLQLRTNGDYTTGGNIWYAPVTNGVVGTYNRLGLDNTHPTNFGFNMLSADLNITMTKKSQTVNDVNYSWEITVTNTSNTTVFKYLVPASEISDTLFANGANLVAGSKLTSAVSKFVLNNVTYRVPSLAVDNADLSMVTPVVMRAAVTADLTSAASWTFLGDIPLSSVIINSYTDRKLEYTGLPYNTADISKLGWTNSKIIKIYDNQDVRYNNDGNLFVYMNTNNIGGNFAAFFKVNVTSNTIEPFITPSGEKQIFVPLPGGNNNFEIIYDTTSALYWLVTTENINSTSSVYGNKTRISLYYSSNAHDWIYAGYVANGLTGDTNASLSVEGDDLLVTAKTNGILQYRVTNFRELSSYRSLLNWSSVRGYSASDGITSGENVVILNGNGGATCDVVAKVSEGTEISVTVTPKQLVLSNNNLFSVALVNASGSFVGTQNDTASGMVVSIKSFSDYNSGFNLWYAPVTSGTIGTENRLGEKNIGGTLLDTDILVTFIKRKQTINNIDYSWVVKVTNSRSGETFEQMIPTLDVPENTFENGVYLAAGCRNVITTQFNLSGIAYIQHINGDLNNDKELNVLDLIYFKNCLLKTKEPENYVLSFLDIDNNGSVDIRDILFAKNLIINRGELL